MIWNLLILVAIWLESGLGLDCTQIPPSSISDGNTVYLPGPSADLQLIPANFNCIYKISAPGNSTNGFSANIVLKNGIRGVNDYITVEDLTGRVHTLNNKTGLGGAPNTYVLVPGSEMTIQVVTKSVDMTSMFSITVDYHTAKIGPIIPMKTGGEMNYFDLSTLRDGKTMFNSVTFVGNEPIYMSLAIAEIGLTNCWDCFVIDGTIDNQTQVYRLADIDLKPFTTKSNSITILTSVDDFFGVVLNPESEAKQFTSLTSLATERDVDNSIGMGSSIPGLTFAAEIVNFSSVGIIMEDLEITSLNCTAYVVSGPPNNSSEVLLDLATAKMPHSFGLKYLTVICLDCELSFSVRSYNN